MNDKKKIKKVFYNIFFKNLFFILFRLLLCKRMIIIHKLIININKLINNIHRIHNYISLENSKI